MVYFCIFLFFYSSWAFLRIGHLHRRIEDLDRVLADTLDTELSELWTAFNNHVQEKEK